MVDIRILLIGWAVIAVVFLLNRGAFHGIEGGDAQYYVAMAENPAEFTKAPYGYRILTPVVVHLLPISVEQGFKLVTLLALSLSLLLLAYYLLVLRMSAQEINIAVGIWVTSFAVFYNINNTWLVDATSYIFIRNSAKLAL